jgi:hypothetical protein
MSTRSLCTGNRSLVDHLRRQLSRPLEETLPRQILPTGISPLDALLPERGVRSGSIVEWLSTRGSGASTLAWLMARTLQQSGRTIVVVDAQRECFPPAVCDLRLDLARVLIVQPTGLPETLWAIEQCLRSPAGCVVLARQERLPHQTYRRLKLAAERGSGIGLFLRPLQSQKEPSWADVRLLVEALPSEDAGDSRFAAHLKCAAKPPWTSQRQSLQEGVHLTRRLKLQLLHVRGGGFQPQQATVVINDEASIHEESHLVSVDSQLARTASGCSAARAS